MHSSLRSQVESHISIPLPSDCVSFSLRRYYVDAFHRRRVSELRPHSLLLDVGGNKIQKRGVFDIGEYDLRVVYLNASAGKDPDVLADGAFIPFRDECFEAVICSELLEHVPDPRAVVAEISRVLKKKGVLLICAPFLFPIHGDPMDYGRYTDFHWKEILEKAGFEEIEIEKQGLFWAVLMDMIRGLVCHSFGQGRVLFRPFRRWIGLLVHKGFRKAIKVDARPDSQRDPFLSRYTTGFGIRAVKRG